MSYFRTLFVVCSGRPCGPGDLKWVFQGDETRGFILEADGTWKELGTSPPPDSFWKNYVPKNK